MIGVLSATTQTETNCSGALPGTAAACKGHTMRVLTPSLTRLVSWLLLGLVAQTFVACGGGSGGSSAGAVLPAAPGGLQITVGNAQLTLQWSGVSNATSYVVARATSSAGPFATVGTPAAPSFVDTGVANGTTYYYVVAAVDSAGQGANSPAVSGTPVQPVPPTAPTGLTATTASYASVDLNWNATSDVLGVASYSIERCTGSACTDFAAVGSTSSTSYADNGLAASTTYSYRIKAIDAAQISSAYSNNASATTAAAPVPPSAPAQLSAVASSSTQVNLGWTPSTDALGIQSYTIERCTGSACTNFATLATVTSTSYADTGLAASTAYTYRVLAVDVAGISSAYSNSASATTAAPPNPPAPPGPLVAAALATANGSAQVSLAWQASATAGTIPYSVERCAGAGCTNFSVITATTGTAYVDTTVASGTTYLYQVRAGNVAGGFSAYSGPAAVNTYSSSALPAQVPTGNPGLRNADGSTHVLPAPNPDGTLINVVQRAAELGYVIDLTDSANDDRPGIEAVLLDAQTTAGSTVYFPDGTYNLVTPWSTNANADIVLTKSQVNLAGQSEAGTILKSSFDDLGSLTASYTGILVSGAQNLVIHSLTITSTWNRAWATSTSGNSASAGGVTYALVIKSGGSPASAASNVVVEDVLVERYHRMGIVAGPGSHDIVIRGCVAMDATDIGDGGTGYGFVAEGPGHVQATTNPNLGIPTKDQYFTLFDNNRAYGPNIRHAILLQYWSHNNLVAGNILDDTQLVSISLHGEDEYANEMATNAITRDVDGIGIGNSGATHDASGPYNWAHNNDIAASVSRGFFVEYGSPSSTIESNTVRDTTAASGVGVLVGSSSNSVLRNNTFVDNTGSGYIAVKFIADPTMNASPAGGPVNWIVSGNSVVNSGTPFTDASAGAASGDQVQSTW